MLGQLMAGSVRDLAGQQGRPAAASAEQFAGLRRLIGFGRSLFDREGRDHELTGQVRPTYLSYLSTGPDGPFPSLPWTDGLAVNLGEADVVIQLTADRESAVTCAAVEIWKLICDAQLPLRISASFGGFGRQDGRGWLDFHDGVSNLDASQRLEAIEARNNDPVWMNGGTYMALLRLAIDLALWRSLERREQELLIGRNKLSGAALVRVERDHGGKPVPIAASIESDAPSPTELADWRDPPQTLDPLIEASHIHRANQNRGSAASEAAFRMFRQGYDFFDGFADGTPRVGLNFVSFQRDLASFHHVLHLPGWLGDSNFGGPEESADLQARAFVSVLAGGLYAVPPLAEPFPGVELFADGV